MINERNVVANVGSTFCRPNFAKIATNAAVNAARKAYKIHMYLFPPFNSYDRYYGVGTSMLVCKITLLISTLIYLNGDMR